MKTNTSHDNEGGPCADAYAFVLTPGWLAAERAAIGGNVGANGYTTFAQADMLAERLDVGPGQRVLDVGCGRGWPGAYIAERTGCSAVLTDVPKDALMSASDRYEGREDISIVRSTGTDLPFVARSFDAISHADVLC